MKQYKSLKKTQKKPYTEKLQPRTTRNNLYFLIWMIFSSVLSLGPMATQRDNCWLNLKQRMKQIQFLHPLISLLAQYWSLFLSVILAYGKRSTAPFLPPSWQVSSTTTFPHLCPRTYLQAMDPCISIPLKFLLLTVPSSSKLLEVKVVRTSSLLHFSTLGNLKLWGIFYISRRSVLDFFLNQKITCC